MEYLNIEIHDKIFSISSNINEINDIIINKYPIVQTYHNIIPYFIEVIFINQPISIPQGNYNIIEKSDRIKRLVSHEEIITFIDLGEERQVLKNIKDDKIKIYFNSYENIDYVFNCIECFILNILTDFYQGIVIHASSLLYKDVSIHFVGNSGCGKSTLAALALLNGICVVENEHTIISVSDGFEIRGVSQYIDLKADGANLIRSYKNFNSKLQTYGASDYYRPKKLIFVFPSFSQCYKNNIVEVNYEMKFKSLFNQLIIADGLMNIDKKDIFNRFAEVSRYSVGYIGYHIEGDIFSSVDLLNRVLEIC